MKLKKEQIVPGQLLKVKDGKELHLDAPFMLGGSSMATALTTLVVVSKPRRKDSINLVRVACLGKEYECFYCDIVYNCELG